jgi:hypothetical protein
MDTKRPAAPNANASTAASNNCYFVFEFLVHKAVYL